MSKKAKIIIGVVVGIMLLGMIGCYIVKNKIERADKIEIKKEKEELELTEKILNEKTAEIELKVKKTEEIKILTANNENTANYTIMYDINNKIIEIKKYYISQNEYIKRIETQYYINNEFRYFKYIYEVKNEKDISINGIGEIVNGIVGKYYISSDNDKKNVKWKNGYFENEIKPKIKSFMVKLKKSLELKIKEIEEDEVDSEEFEENLYLNKSDINFDKENEIILVKVRESCNFSLEIFKNNGKLIAKDKIEDAFYDTQISTGDIDRDGIAEIMLSVDCGGTAATNNYYIYKINGKSLKKLEIPDDMAEVSIEENKVNVYLKKIDSTLEIKLKKEDVEEIEMIENQAAEDNQDVTQGEANEYMFQKEDGETKLIEEKRFGYGSNHENSCVLGTVYLKYSYNNGWKLEEMYEGSFINEKENKNVEVNQ